MHLPRPIPGGRSLFAALLLGCSVAAVSQWRPSLAKPPEVSEAEFNVASRIDNTQSTSWSSPLETKDTTVGTDRNSTEVDQSKRGIRPPWRENAIPELRRQPGHKAKTAAA